MDSEEMKRRTKIFAINIVRLTEKLPDTLANRINKNQIIRASSSVGANYRAYAEQNQNRILLIN